MVRLPGGLLLFTACALAVPASPSTQITPAQQILSDPVQSPLTPPRKLQGRFLHITDIHPDPYYKPRTDPDGEHPCHAGEGPAGYYGAETTDCDTPFSLVNATFQWINDNLKGDIDFVIWTGDSARHDNDEHLPRTEQIVVDSNRYIVDKFVDVFGKTDNINDPDPTNDFVVPIVPTFGNNDILPHNIFEPGPNKWTRRYSDVWSRFVPPAQRHSFARGGWFFTEVIPNRLAIFSLNTLYFFDSNSAVDGCDLKSEPGYEHMEWLRVQLQFMRERGMKAILTGHVPPARTETKQNWDETCYQKYTLWLRQYRDVVVGSIWGHMNIDHFMFHDVKDLTYDFHIDGVDDEFASDPQSKTSSDDGTFSVAAKATYLNELRDEWSTLPTPPKGSSYLTIEADFADDTSTFSKKKKKKGTKKDRFLRQIGGPWGERFSMGLIAPSVVPNYFPTLRVVEYNITGLEHEHPALSAIGSPEEMTHEADDLQNGRYESSDLGDAHTSEFHDLRKDKKGKKGKKKKPKPPFKVPKAPAKTASPGPAYSPQSLSLLSWTQYYANLTKIHEAIERDKVDTTGKKDHDEHFQYQVEYTTNNDDEYRMKDLTVRSWLDLAQKIGRAEFPRLSMHTEEQEEEGGDFGPAKKKNKHKKHKKGKKEKGSTRPKNRLWRTFVKRAFVNTKREEDLDDQFG